MRIADGARILTNTSQSLGILTEGMHMKRNGRQTVTIAFIVLCGALAVSCQRARDDVFYAIAESPASPKLIKIQPRGVNQVVVTTVGGTGTFGCAPVAPAPDGKLYTVCGKGIVKPGPQKLATLDPQTGHATVFGQTITGLQIMGMKFAPDGKLYTVGDANPASPTFNSLYTIDVTTGAVTRIGPTGAPSFFHDLAIDRQGSVYGTSADALYTIDLKTGTATKVASFVGGGMIMGLSFNADRSQLYATDWKEPVSDVYSVDLRTGFLTPLGPTGLALTHSLASIAR